jgi:hypothetical protein
MEIKGYPNYLIFRNGKILSKGFDKWHPPRFLKERLDSKGYPYVNLYHNKQNKKFRIHRLLMEHFVPNPNNYPVVDHIDRDRTNNKLSNLRWCSQSTNVINTGLRCDNKSGIKNITWDKNRNRYQFQIKRNGKKTFKRFKTLEEAIEFKSNFLNNLY